LQSILKR